MDKKNDYLILFIKLCITFLFLGCLLILIKTFNVPPKPLDFSLKNVTVSFKTTAAGDDNFQVFYDTGKSWTEEDSHRYDFAKSAGKTLEFTFQLPAVKIKALRFDPTTTAGPVEIQYIKIGDETWNSEDIKKDFDAGADIGAFSVKGDWLYIQPTGVDSRFYLSSTSFGRNKEFLAKVTKTSETEEVISVLLAILLFTALDTVLDKRLRSTVLKITKR